MKYMKGLHDVHQNTIEISYRLKESSYAAYSGGRCSDLTLEEVQHTYLYTYLRVGFLERNRENVL